MTPEKTIEAFRSCKAKFPGCAPARYPADSWATEEKYDYVRSHLVWMCEEGERLVEAGLQQKAMRWLGFVQGAMWSWLPVSIAELKDINRAVPFVGTDEEVSRKKIRAELGLDGPRANDPWISRSEDQ